MSILDRGAMHGKIKEINVTKGVLNNSIHEIKERIFITKIYQRWDKL